MTRRTPVFHDIECTDDAGIGVGMSALQTQDFASTSYQMLYVSVHDRGHIM